jgi:hypothetical protein
MTRPLQAASATFSSRERRTALACPVVEPRRRSRMNGRVLNHCVVLVTPQEADATRRSRA